MNKGLKSFLLPFVRPFLPLIYRKRFRQLVQQIELVFLSNPEIFFFFPAYHMGGAEKVHLQILDAVRDRQKAVFICYKSASDVLRADFEQASDQFVDFHVLGNYAHFRKRLRSLFVRKLNELDRPATLFGCNVTLFYDIADGLTNPLVRRVDLLHAFSPYICGIEERAAKSIASLDCRVVINQQTKMDLASQYASRSVDSRELNKVKVIYNALQTECEPTMKQDALPLRCLWVARGSREKRPWLYVSIAREAKQRGLPLEFSMVGDVNDLIDSESEKDVNLLGPVHDWSRLEAIYQSHDLLLTTSVYEGFPLTISESICNGLVNLSTAVGGIPEHIHHGETGFLVGNSDHEQEIVAQFIQLLDQLCQNPEQLGQIREQARIYISSVFSRGKFYAGYRSILIHDK